VVTAISEENAASIAGLGEKYLMLEHAAIIFRVETAII
jgi:hypothetical protein